MKENLLKRIAEALERLAPPKPPKNNLNEATAYLWHARESYLEPIKQVQVVPLSLLRGIDHVKNILFENTQRFASGYSANNALLWGARGMGKSSLVKALHAEITTVTSYPLILIEIYRDDIDTLPDLLAILKRNKKRFIVFCDDLSFDEEEKSYKHLKTLIEGGLTGKPDNIIFYATSNRRHMLPRDIIENEESDAIHGKEVIDEKVSLSDRFGLWLGFHTCSQEEYLEIVKNYSQYYKLKINPSELKAEALEWSATRGSRSGRVAWQFILDLTGRLKTKI